MNIPAPSRKGVARHGKIALTMLPVALMIAVGMPMLAHHVLDQLADAETQRRQVVVDWVGQDYAVVSGQLRWTAFGTKARGQCVYAKGQVVTATVPTADGSVERRVEFLEDLTPESNRPPGRQSFGRWAVSADGVIPGEIVATVKHYCPSENGREVVITVAGPFSYGG